LGLIFKEKYFVYSKLTRNWINEFLLPDFIMLWRKVFSLLLSGWEGCFGGDAKWGK